MNLPLFAAFLIALGTGPAAAAQKDSAAREDAAETASDEPEVKVLDKDKGGCTWVESAATVAFGESDTKHQAHAQAVAKARSQAMNKFLGLNLRHQFMDFQQEGLKGQAGLTENLLRVTQMGRVLKERIVKDGPEDAPGCRGCRYGVRLKVCIVPQDEKADKGFRVQLQLNRTRFVEGDEAVLSVTPTRDAYVYIFNVDMSWDATLIVPNQLAPEKLIKGGETLMYPDEELKRKYGARIVAELPEGADISAEMIRVIASKAPLPQTVLDLPLSKRIEKLSADRVTPRGIAEALGVDEKKVQQIRARLGIPPEDNADRFEAWRKRYLKRGTSRADVSGGEGESEVQGDGSFLALLSEINAEEIEWVDDVLGFTIYKK